MTRDNSRTLWRAVCAVLAGTACVIVLLQAPAQASGYTPISGAGSTWSQVAIDQWRADVARQGLTVNYQGLGSSAGRAFFISHSVDFAVSEIPFQGPANQAGSELYRINHSGIKYQYLPIVAGGTSLMYNLTGSNGQQIKNLRLDSRLAALIFTGGIQYWDDQQIRAQNPGTSLPHTHISVVVRADGSGTSAQFTAYLAYMQKAIWAKYAKAEGIPPTFTSNYPTDNFPGGGITAQSGSDGVANYISNPGLGAGSIGYVERAYALQRGFPVASLRNRAGAYVQPTANDVAVALQHVTLNADNTQNLGGVYNAPESNAYPMSSYSYMITQTTGFDPAKGKTLGAFMVYFACTGQQWADRLGYSPLPTNLVKIVFDAVRNIPGAAAPPPIDKTHCPNPQVTGGFHASPAPPGGGTSTATASAHPHQSGSPTAAPSAGSTGSLGATAVVSNIDILPSASRDAYIRAAGEEIAGAKPPSALPLLVVALVVAALIFGPLFLRLRSRDMSDR
jgi:phosphate transport system substrate-binding protein